MSPPECGEKTLLSNQCPNISDSMLQSGIKFGAAAYIYGMTTAFPMEVTSAHSLLLSLLNCLVTGDVTTCSVLAECSHRIPQLRSKHFRLWLNEDFRFSTKDMQAAMTQFDALIATGSLELPGHVFRSISSLAEFYRITLQSKESSDDLAQELEEAVADNSACEIISVTTKGGNVNGSTQSGDSLVHLAVRTGSRSSIAALGFLKADLEESSDDLAQELEEAVADNSACEIISVTTKGGNVNGSTQSGDSLVHLAVRTGSRSSIAALGFLKADLEVLNAAGASPLEEAIKKNSASSIKGLISAGAKVERRFLRGNSYLHIAAAAGKNEALQALLEAGLDPNTKNHLGETPLVLAVKEGNVQGVEILMRRVGNASLVSELKKDLLKIAVASANVDMLRLLLKYTTTTDLRFEKNDTLAHLIVHASNPTEMLKLLEGRSMEFNIRNTDGFAPLHLAADASVVRMLLALGANINFTTSKGETALHTASSHGFLEVVKVLVQRGAGIDVKDNEGVTALMTGANNTNSNILITYLLHNGADLTLKSKKNFTALHYVAEGGCTECALTLLDNGARLDEMDSNGLTSLHLAAREGHIGIVKELLDRGANLSAKENYGETPLMKASYKVKELLDRGAPLNDKDKYGNTALHKAAWGGHVDVVKELLDRGAPLNDKDNGGYTALHEAVRGGHVDVVKELLDRGAPVNARTRSGSTALGMARNEDIKNYLKSKGGVW
ncbi:putative ankyrin repeat protein RF_0381 [Halyomorpha halys]|uniref:putative ankyrin repeat protein RF_0381 n=1 Tax=Halyomorpha halys TaxID=286706 RepID=UPI0006D4EB06